MPVPIQGQNRGELRRLIGPSLGMMQVGEATSTVDTSSLIDTLNLKGRDDEHNGKEVVIFSPAGSIVAGEKSRVADYAGATSDATCAPVFTASITDGDGYELWKTPWLSSDVNKAIDEAILKASARCLQYKLTEEIFTKASTYLYDAFSGFESVNLIEYEHNSEAVVVDDCNTVWTAGANVTASLETSRKIEGTGSVKLVAAAGVAAGGILGYATFGATDLSKYDKLEISLYSSIALAAGELDYALDDTAAIASPVESLDIPATSKNIWTRHIIDLANPLLDTAIISGGLVNTTDVGAFTIYIDYIRAVDSTTRQYVELNPQYWSVQRSTTPLLQITPTALGVMGNPRLLKITGRALPALLTDDTTDSEIDPDFIINMAKGLLMTGHSKSRTLDIQNREDKGEKFISLAMARLNSISTNVASNSRSVR